MPDQTESSGEPPSSALPSWTELFEGEVAPSEGPVWPWAVWHVLGGTLAIVVSNGLSWLFDYGEPI